MNIDQDNVQKFNAYGAPVQPTLPVDQIFDSSGWSVATSGSKATATSEKAEGLNLPPWLLAVFAAVVVVGWIRTAK
jgi:hypothetical protein